jgi:hypothetical protein
VLSVRRIQSEKLATRVEDVRRGNARHQTNNALRKYPRSAHAPKPFSVMKSIPKFYEYLPGAIPVEAAERHAVIDQVAAVGNVERGY